MDNYSLQVGKFCASGRCWRYRRDKPSPPKMRRTNPDVKAGDNERDKLNNQLAWAVKKVRSSSTGGERRGSVFISHCSWTSAISNTPVRNISKHTGAESCSGRQRQNRQRIQSSAHGARSISFARWQQQDSWIQNPAPRHSG